MEGSDRADDFIPASLAALGIEADEIELAVMAAAQATFWQPIREMLAVDTSASPPERRLDLSRPPSE